MLHWCKVSVYIYNNGFIHQHASLLVHLQCQKIAFDFSSWKPPSGNVWQEMFFPTFDANVFLNVCFGDPPVEARERQPLRSCPIARVTRQKCAAVMLLAQYLYALKNLPWKTLPPLSCWFHLDDETYYTQCGSCLPHMKDSGWTSRTGFVCYLNISLDIQ